MERCRGAPRLASPERSSATAPSGLQARLGAGRLLGLPGAGGGGAGEPETAGPTPGRWTSSRARASSSLSSSHLRTTAAAVGAALEEPNPECSFRTTTTISGSSAGAKAANQAWSRWK